VSRRAVFVVVAIEGVRVPSAPFVRSPVRVASGSPWRAGWRGRCPAGYDGACGVRMAVRSWRPLWTPDATAWTLDGDRACGRSASSMGAGGPDGRVRMLVAAGVGRRRACALPSYPVRARTCRPRGWPWPAARRMVGRWALEVSAAWPSPSGPGPGPIGWAVTSNWGCPADRTVKRSAMSVGRPATARVSAGGTDQRRRVQGVSGDGSLAEVGGQPDCGHVRQAMARSSRCPPGGPGLGARVDERLRRGSLLRHRSGRRWRVGRVGQRVSVSGSPSVGAGGPGGVLLDVGSLSAGLIGSRRANRSAGLAGVEPNIKKPIGHIPLAKQN
jgi:hypothetical protein